MLIDIKKTEVFTSLPVGVPGQNKGCEVSPLLSSELSSAQALINDCSIGLYDEDDASMHISNICSKLKTKKEELRAVNSDLNVPFLSDVCGGKR